MNTVMLAQVIRLYSADTCAVRRLLHRGRQPSGASSAEGSPDPGGSQAVQDLEPFRGGA